MQFTVERSKWRCGHDGELMHGEGDTGLLNAEGFMCCLGFASHRCGVPKKMLREAGYPECLAGSIDSHESLKTMVKAGILDYSDHGSLINGSLAVEASDLNDDDKISRTKREKELVKVFKKHGHVLTFTGQYSDVQK